MDPVTKFMRVLLLYISCASVQVARPQLVFMPDVALRGALNEQFPGLVDAGGYMDTTDAQLTVNELTLTISWPNSDLSGLEYFNTGSLDIYFSEQGLGGTPPPRWPEGIVWFGVSNAGWNEMPSLPARLESLGLSGCGPFTQSPALPDTLYYLTLRDLEGFTLPAAWPFGLFAFNVEGVDGLSSLPPFPETLAGIQIIDQPLLTDLPPLPSDLDGLEIVRATGLAQLPDLPVGLSRITFEDLPLITSMPPMPLSIYNLTCLHLPALQGTMTFPGDQLYTLSITGSPQFTVVLPAYVTEGFVIDSVANVDLSLLQDYGAISILRNIPTLTAVPDLPNDVLEFINLPLTEQPQFTDVPQYLALEGMPGLTTISQWPVLGLALRNMTGITQLPALPNWAMELRLNACENLHCLPPVPPQFGNFVIEPGTPIGCVPNTWLNDPGSLPLCTPLDTCVELTTEISGRVFWDQDADGLMDVGEPGIPTATVWASPESYGTGTDATGSYDFLPLLADYTITATANSPHVISISPSAHTASITSPSTVDSENNFAVQMPAGVQDISVSLEPGRSAPGAQSLNYLTYTNVGTTPVNASMTFNFEWPRLWVSSSVPPDVLGPNYATWQLGEVPFAGTGTVEVMLRTDTQGVLIGDVLSYTLSAGPVIDDALPSNNEVTVVDTVVGSIDPNDKRVFPRSMTPEQVTAGEELQYTIRFQNTGTYHASRVIITDTLSSLLQWNTMRLISSSHPCSWSMANGVLYFHFDPIFLPDSTTDEPNSHGFVKFAMRPSTSLMLGEVVGNIANIYFDYNEPVITNEAVFAVEENTSISEHAQGGLHLWPNPAGEVLWMEGVGNAVVEVLGIDGRVVLRQRILGTQPLDIHDLSPGTYTARIGDGRSMPFVKR